MPDLRTTLDLESFRRVVFVSGAGVSAASGIPTFRGPEGYWTVGARNYHPQEMATRERFEQMPKQVWRWYLYRRGVCRAAQPNAAHRALARLEAEIGDDFGLLSQNVDGLHLRAGNSAARTHEVHGNIDFMRCAGRCDDTLVAIEAHFDDWPKARELDDDDFARLRCTACEGPMRPHVLWFDEYYEEGLFRFQSGLERVERADLLVFVGCSGAANLPRMAASVALERGCFVLDINPEPNPFSELALAMAARARDTSTPAGTTSAASERAEGGAWLRGPADTLVPALVDGLLEARQV